MLTRENGFTLPLRWQFPDAGRYAFTFIALFVSLLAIYSNSFYGEWHFDDFGNIVDNPNIKIKSISWQDVKQFVPGIGGFPSRPLPNLTFALNHALGELNVFGFHVVNFFIHYLAAIFLFLFIYNTLKLPRLKDQYENIAYPVALLAAFFWAIHPVWVSSVTYIVQRMNSMAGMFYILSMYFYLKARTTQKAISSIVFFIGCTLAGAGAMLSKENAFMLPVSLLLLDLFLIQGINRENVKKFFIILSIPCVLIFILGWFYTGGLSNVMTGYEIRNFSLAERLLTEPRVILFYLSLLFYPISSRLTLLYDIEISRSLFSPWTTLPALALILMIIGFALYLSRKRPLISFCILFYFLNHLIEGTIFPLELIYEHRNYIPAMLLFVPVAAFIIFVINYFSYRKAIQTTVAIGIIIIIFGLGDTTFSRNKIVSDDFLLWNDNISKSPSLSRPHTNLGRVYHNLEDRKKALAEYETALRLNRFDNKQIKAVQETNLGIYFFEENQNDLAMDYFKKSSEVLTEFRDNTIYMAKILLRKGRTSEAKQIIEEKLKKYPYNRDLLEMNSLICLKETNVNQAQLYAKKCLMKYPNSLPSLMTMAEICRIKKRYDCAKAYWRSVQSLTPHNPFANLALLEISFKVKDSKMMNEELRKLSYLQGSFKFNEYIDEMTKDDKLCIYIPQIDNYAFINERCYGP